MNGWMTRYDGYPFCLCNHSLLLLLLGIVGIRTFRHCWHLRFRRGLETPRGVKQCPWTIHEWFSPRVRVLCESSITRKETPAELGNSMILEKKKKRGGRKKKRKTTDNDENNEYNARRKASTTLLLDGYCSTVAGSAQSRRKRRSHVYSVTNLFTYLSLR